MKLKKNIGVRLGGNMMTHILARHLVWIFWNSSWLPFQTKNPISNVPYKNLNFRGKQRIIFTRKGSNACKEQLWHFTGSTFFFSILHTWIKPLECDKMVDSNNNPWGFQLQTCDWASLSRDFPLPTTHYFPRASVLSKTFSVSLMHLAMPLFCFHAIF